MADNPDDLATHLAHITDQAAQAATTNSQTRALINAARTGDADKVRQLAEALSTADLQRIKQQLERNHPRRGPTGADNGRAPTLWPCPRSPRLPPPRRDDPEHDQRNPRPNQRTKGPP